MKRKVRIYKAQMGGVQTMQNTAAQAQPTDEDLMQAAMALIQRGSTAEETLQALIDADVDQEKATQIVSGLISYIGQQRDQDIATYEDDQMALEDLDADQQVQEQAAAEEEAYKQRMQQMYETDMSADDAEADAEEDQFMQENILARGGQKLPSKRNFVHRTVQTLRAQEGLQTGKNIADSTDTGARSEALSKFVGGLQSAADLALMKKDAEQMYGQQMESEFDDTEYAQFGLNMRTGQQRRLNRRLNKMIGQVPLPQYNGIPGVITYPQINSPFSQMPTQDSYYGGPKLANIDVRKTGLFGRPKEYTITFAQEAYTNPTLRKQILKQEARNKKVLTEDEIDALINEAEEVTETTSETPKAQEEQVKSGKKDISSSSQNASSGNRAQQVIPVAATEEAAPAATEYVNPMDAITQRNSVLPGGVEIPNPFANAPASPGYVNPMDAAMQNYASAKQTMNTGEFGAGPGVVEAKSKYSNQNTPQDSVYYNPDKPNFLYTYRDGNLYYDDASDSKQDWHAIKDQSRIAELNSKLRGANLYTLPSKAGFYYRQRPDGSYAKFQGDPAKHNASAKQVQIITPSDKNYKYLDQNKEYSFTFTGKKQMGGFTDMDSGLNKFVYGGNEGFVIPETGGKLTNSPYFEEGGYLPQAQRGYWTGVGENAKWHAGVHPDDLAELATNRLSAKRNNSTKNSKSREIDDYSEEYYNSYSPYVFPGGYAKQKGLPYDPVTGEIYKGFIGPDTQLNKIDVRRSNMLTGAPKKYTMYFGNYDPTKPLIGQSPSNAPTASQNKSEKWTRKQDRQAVRDQLGTGYKLSQLFQNSMSSKENDKSPRLRNWFDQKRSEKLNMPFLEPKAYGGDMGYAQTGQNYPYRNDPRFGTVYTDNPEYVGLTDMDLITPEVNGMPAVGAQNVMGSWYDTEPGANMPSRSEAQMAADPSLQIDPTQGNRQTTIKNLPGDFAVDVKTKATNADLRNSLNNFNTAVNAGLSVVGGIGERERLRKMYENYSSDSIYGNSAYLDRGTYEANSGLFKPDEMGFKGVVKNGGYMQDGGDFSPYETYMSEDQIQKFLEEGGELEFV